MTISLSFGAVVRIAFPYTDQAKSKVAPAVVLSVPKFHTEYGQAIVARITSQLQHKDRFGAVVVRDHSHCGLFKPSVIKPVIMTVELSQIQVIGHLDDRTLGDVKRAFRNVLAFTA